MVPEIFKDQQETDGLQSKVITIGPTRVDLVFQITILPSVSNNVSDSSCTRRSELEITKSVRDFRSVDKVNSQSKTIPLKNEAKSEYVKDKSNKKIQMHIMYLIRIVNY